MRHRYAQLKFSNASSRERSPISRAMAGKLSSRVTSETRRLRRSLRGSTKHCLPDWAPTLGNRWFADSAQEESGFEPSVPPCERVGLSGRNAKCEPGDKDGLERVGDVAGTTRHARIDGSVRVAGEEVLSMPARALRDLRGGKVAMIFQEPMTALDPVYTVGQQMGEAVRRHTRCRRAAARIRAPRTGAHPLARAPARRLSARAVGRLAPARERKYKASPLWCDGSR